MKEKSENSKPVSKTPVHQINGNLMLISADKVKAKVVKRKRKERGDSNIMKAAEIVELEHNVVIFSLFNSVHLTFKMHCLLCRF